MLKRGTLPPGSVRGAQRGYAQAGQQILDARNLPFGSGRDRGDREADEQHRRRRRIDPTMKFTKRPMVMYDRDKDFLRWFFITDEYEAQRPYVFGIYQAQSTPRTRNSPALPVIARVFGFYVSYCKEVAPVYRIGYVMMGLVTVPTFREYVKARCPTGPFERFVDHLSRTVEKLMIGEATLPRSYQKFVPLVAEMQTWYLTA